MRSNPVALIWLLGALAAIAVYAAGANDLLAGAWLVASHAALLADLTLRHLADTAADLIPALAIGALVAFVPLAALAIRAGQRGRLALVAVPLAFLWLTSDFPTRMEWLEALVLAAGGALAMTGRLRNNARFGVPGAPERATRP